jgi:hypothetical protein
VSASDNLRRVQQHLEAYDHPLLTFSAHQAPGAESNAVEVAIDLKHRVAEVHTYLFTIHARDLSHPQFAWNLQRQLYDALHDYLIEMFTHTPQDPPSLPSEPSSTQT